MSILFRYKPGSAGNPLVRIAGSTQPDSPDCRQQLLYELLHDAGQDTHSAVIGHLAGGKPFLQTDSGSFPISVSHTRGLLLIALSTGPQIGLDTEPAARKVPERLLARIRSAEDAAFENQLPPLKLWTLKEAFLKMTGTGLRHPMRAVSVSPAGDHYYLCKTVRADGTPLQALTVSFMWREFRIALAVEHP
ncbi:4'-phosphopantetheinyl transferase superfamily protein [Cyclonatronum proteinivorum]|uniref:4'-phosphopantetheinyl transferase superfamily protein n=1 Tax=Cyclonatronum proteinivorum TaxID=1457365 RepID=A0A345UIV4_9BACT|nr:4'-phosphopantetheinyl transferase superfamily protein [Cyclonatronum proteinivorum]AXJ00406.1 4'-phosphopantetheinyl transferase superfamily protein [Cyclonatronum proteinivorum]